MPILEHIRTNELDPDTEAWFIAVLEVMESLDAAAFVAFTALDVEIVMGAGGPTLRGRAEVLEALTTAWSGLESLVHEEANIYGSGDRFVHEAVTRVVTTDGRRVETRTCVWIDRDDDGRILSARTY